MDLSDRDRRIVQLVARFKQATAAQIHNIVFDNTPSRTPSDRALRRLIQLNYLNRIERRTVGGARGGSGQYVYQLGRRGYYLYFTGGYSPVRTVNYHSLAILECFVVLRGLEREGVLTVAGMSTEPDCHVLIGSTWLKPDLYVELERSKKRRKLWLEVDMATEGQKQLRGKLESYWRAYNDADVEDWPVFPKVLWLAVDAERAVELKWLIEQMSPEAQALFSVCTRDDLSTTLLS